MQHHGKEMPYNYLDADAAWNYLSEFSDPTCVIVKHTNPVGWLPVVIFLMHTDWQSKVSAYCGVVASNVEIDENLAREIGEFRSPTNGETRMFYEIVVAPKDSKKGLEVLLGKPKTSRILEAKKNEKGELVDAKSAWLCVEHVMYTYSPNFKNPGAITRRKIIKSVIYPLYAFQYNSEIFNLPM